MEKVSPSKVKGETCANGVWGMLLELKVDVDRCCRCHVETSSMSTYCYDWEHLRVGPHTTADFRYCPGGPDSDFEYSTQSYTGYEPTSMRAIRARYDPYEQARGRIDQLRVLGHNVDKVAVLITC